MDLSKRLKWIIEKLDKCDVIVDVGTDHGYIPIELIKRNFVKKAIATDINKDPLKKAGINASLDGVSSKIDLRLGGGLAPLNKGEAQGVIIAGMGGNLIRDILEADLDKVKAFDYLILQPAQNPEVLREYLYTHDYEIIDEDLCLDEGKYYEIFKVKYKKGDYIALESIYYEISPMMLNKKIPLLKEYIQSKVDKAQTVINFIKDDTEHAINRKNELKDKISKMESMLKVL